MTTKIFGREPALVVGAIGSVLTVVAALNLDFLSAGQAAALTALISAGIIAATTNPKAPALFTGVWSAAVALFAEYGLELSDELVASVTCATVAIFALITREQVSPRETFVTNP